MIGRILPAGFTPRHCLISASVFFALLVVIGAIPGEAKTLSATVNDKFLHFSAYAILSCLIYGSITGSVGSRALRSLLVVALLGALDEAIQGCMPYRVADASDWMFDMMAAMVSITTLSLLVSTQARRRHRQTDYGPMDQTE